MDINGCHVVPEPATTTDEGFLTTVQREGVIRGPFKTIQEAIAAAHHWQKESEAEARQMPRQLDGEASVVVNTISESIAVQLEKPAENPPVIEQRGTTTNSPNFEQAAREDDRVSRA
jgi:hypothetical protein